MDRMGRRIVSNNRIGAAFFFFRPGRRGLACGVISRREFERGPLRARARVRHSAPAAPLAGAAGGGGGRHCGAAARAGARGGRGGRGGGRGAPRGARGAERRARGAALALSGWLKVGRL